MPLSISAWVAVPFGTTISRCHLVFFFLQVIHPWWDFDVDEMLNCIIWANNFSRTRHSQFSSSSVASFEMEVLFWFAFETWSIIYHAHIHSFLSKTRCSFLLCVYDWSSIVFFYMCFKSYDTTIVSYSLHLIFWPLQPLHCIEKKINEKNIHFTLLVWYTINEFVLPWLSVILCSFMAVIFD